MGRMSQAEIDAFLEEPVICKLGCLDADGHPYVVPVWFHAASGGFYIIARERSRWAPYLERDRRVFLCIDGADTRRVLVKGHAEVVEAPNAGDKWVEIGRAMAVRYGGDSGLAYLERTLQEPRWLFLVRPTHLTAWAGGWARRYKHYDW